MMTSQNRLHVEYLIATVVF